MHLAFTEQGQLFAETLRRHARERLLPEYATWDRGTPYPRERLRELPGLGITGLRPRSGTAAARPATSTATSTCDA